ncbi:hypothetical protein [Sphingomonas sp. PAMC 26621]|uniref:hypothetical protein n=1 Tax=Sphingomonas sp. PAMC 26621 TaxID=1112213 RepID=UPI001EE65D16|nr:hypothetical protein [Sphingomonas sp. PAMC 26621]
MGRPFEDQVAGLVKIRRIASSPVALFASALPGSAIMKSTVVSASALISGGNERQRSFAHRTVRADSYENIRHAGHRLLAESAALLVNLVRHGKLGEGTALFEMCACPADPPRPEVCDLDPPFRTWQAVERRRTHIILQADKELVQQISLASIIVEQ